MKSQNKNQLDKEKIYKEYQELAEQAYNLRQTNESLSDYFYFIASELLRKLKRST